MDTKTKTAYMGLLKSFDGLGGETWFDKEGYKQHKIVLMRKRIKQFELKLTAKEIIECIREKNKKETNVGDSEQIIATATEG